MEKILKPYSEVKDLIKDGDALLFRNSDIVSKIIQIVGRSDVDHIGMAAWWNGDLMIIETKKTGGQAGLLSNCLSAYNGQVDVYRVTECNPITEKAVSAMRKVTGRKYGWIGILKISLIHLPILRLFFNPDLNDISASKNPPFCSHAFSWAYRQAGVDLVPNLADCMTEPGDLARSAIMKYQFSIGS